MRIFCKGFNLYNQLNGTGNCVAEFRPTLEFDCIDHFHLGHVFSVISTENILKINCNLAEELRIELVGKLRQLTVSDKFLLILNDSGQLFKATIDDWQIKPLPKFDESCDKVKMISCNSKLNVAYSENGSLYSIPEKLEFTNCEIIDIKTGREHCMLLDNTGNVYTFGAGSRGQLGNGELAGQPNPILVKALAGIKISRIAAGGWHSAAISQDGDIYTWGWNGNGQLGLAGSMEGGNKLGVSVMATPHVVDIQGCTENNAVQIACGSKHTIVLLDNKALYGCGWNKYKQLKDEDQEDYHSFIHICDFSKESIVKVMCGPWNSAVICK